jgi:hypothetical protein
MKGLRFVYWVQAIYLTILGIMFWFLPSLAETVFQTELNDPILTPLFGQVLLTVAIVCYIIVMNLEKFIKLTWALIFENAGHIVIFINILATGIAGFVTVGPPLIMSVILLVFFSVFYRQATS